MLADAVILAAGLFAWTLLEYLIHGILSHRFRTFASPLHDVHHRDPHAVFTVGAWIPVALVWAGALALFGRAPGVMFLSGIVAGFAAYEALHYRMHFAWPSCAWEAHLRVRHLAHHYRAPEQIFGVTTALWDRVFSSEPAPARMRELGDAVASIAPLGGRSNARYLLRLGSPAR
jgi:sterol desaturase/sphingolipid hydroxylase (fatty acid hydroxylase superfamily)